MEENIINVKEMTQSFDLDEFAEYFDILKKKNWNEIEIFPPKVEDSESMFTHELQNNDL